MMKASCISETPVVYQITRRHIPENSRLRGRHGENLKFHRDVRLFSDGKQ
jgi:hypothetical protein